MTVINPKIAAWFEKRGISRENAAELGIYTGKQQQIGEETKVVADPEGRIIVFPFMRRGAIVNEKYRGDNKKFWQATGGLKCFYNSDVLTDPQLVEGRAALVIVEGELDLLAVREAGNPFVVSVPDGAPPALKPGEKLQDIDPEHDSKYEYVFTDWEALKKIKRIVIATDADDPGKRLAEELVRRLGRARCSFVTFPDGCKDFNEVLLQEGAAVVAELIARAKPYPVSGIYTYSDLPAEPDLRPISTGWGRLDKNLRPFYPSLMVVTGFAGSGKSCFVNQMVAQMALRSGWKAAIASFEMRVKPFITDVLANTYLEQYQDRGGTVETAMAWVDKNFVFVAPEPSDEDDNFDIGWLIEKAIAAVIRHGIRVLVIDPWNEVEHALRRGESLTEYTGRALRALKRFGREFEVMVIVVAHPTKSAANKDPADVSLYDVSDSAHFANKADFGVIVARVPNATEHDLVSTVLVKKVRYQPDTGFPGFVHLTYDPRSRTFGQ